MARRRGRLLGCWARMSCIAPRVVRCRAISIPRSGKEKQRPQQQTAARNTFLSRSPASSCEAASSRGGSSGSWDETEGPGVAALRARMSSTPHRSSAKTDKSPRRTPPPAAAAAAAATAPVAMNDIYTLFAQQAHSLLPGEPTFGGSVQPSRVQPGHVQGLSVVASPLASPELTPVLSPIRGSSCDEGLFAFNEEQQEPTASNEEQQEPMQSVSRSVSSRVLRSEGVSKGGWSRRVSAADEKHVETRVMDAVTLEMLVEQVEAQLVCDSGWQLARDGSEGSDVCEAGGEREEGGEVKAPLFTLPDPASGAVGDMSALDEFEARLECHRLRRATLFSNGNEGGIHKADLHARQHVDTRQHVDARQDADALTVSSISSSDWYAYSAEHSAELSPPHGPLSCASSVAGSAAESESRFSTRRALAPFGSTRRGTDQASSSSASSNLWPPPTWSFEYGFVQMSLVERCVFSTTHTAPILPTCHAPMLAIYHLSILDVTFQSACFCISLTRIHSSHLPRSHSA